MIEERDFVFAGITAGRNATQDFHIAKLMYLGHFLKEVGGILLESDVGNALELRRQERRIDDRKYLSTLDIWSRWSNESRAAVFVASLGVRDLRDRLSEVSLYFEQSGSAEITIETLRVGQNFLSENGIKTAFGLIAKAIKFVPTKPPIQAAVSPGRHITI